MTALAGDLLFFELELNRLDDSNLNAAMAAPALGHYRPWLEDIRKEKPHQLADDLERLFLDKSVSAAAAWNRLFDDTMAALRFDFEGESLTLEPLLGKLMDPDAKIRETAANALAATLGANLRLLPSSPIRWPRTRRPPTAGASSKTSPTRVPRQSR